MDSFSSTGLLTGNDTAAPCTAHPVVSSYRRPLQTLCPPESLRHVLLQSFLPFPHRDFERDRPCGSVPLELPDTFLFLPQERHPAHCEALPYGQAAADSLPVDSMYLLSLFGHRPGDSEINNAQRETMGDPWSLFYTKTGKKGGQSGETSI